MDYELSVLSDMDVFFFYGEPESDLGIETESDVVAGCIQPKRSLFYNRRDSAGVPEKENYPNTFVLQFMTKYDIVNWVSFRNNNVSNGTNGSPDRRIAVSQSSISLKRDSQNMNLIVNFIPIGKQSKVTNLTIPI